MDDIATELDSLFDEFYQAVNGFAPYEWQRRLVRYVAERGTWPDLLDGPTGSGKTAVLEAHVFLNAFAGRCGVSRAVPRRLVIAVNRRSLVDSQYLHAQKMADLLHKAFAEKNGAAGQSLPILARVATSLAGRWGESGKAAVSEIGPLISTSMRGGLDTPNRDNSWRLYPEAPVIICATPDMVGSRLLFRGYGTSRMMRPVEAGLLACDSVLVIDEAHNNRQLALTARRIGVLEHAAEVQSRSAEFARPSDGEEPAPSGANQDTAAEGAVAGTIARPLQVVESTATPANGGGGRQGFGCISVSEQDVQSDECLASRVSKPKLVELCSTDGGSVHAKQLVDIAFEKSDQRGGVVAVIVNTVRTAVAVEGELRSRLADSENPADTPAVICILGRMRPFDRIDAVRRLSSMSASEGRGFIVGTQALEVGLNYDCHTMVTELCPASALVQRFGRVNRFGRFSDGAAVVVDGGTASKGPYEQDDLDIARAWVQRLIEEHPDGVSAFDLAGIEVPSETGKRTLYQRLETTDVDYLSHTSEHLGSEEGVQTLDGSNADLGLWLRDELGSDADRDVTLVVRAGLPDDPVGAADLVSRVPPLEGELFPCSFSEIRGVMDICWGADRGRSRGKVSGVSASDSLQRAYLLLASEDGRHFHPMEPHENPVPGGVYVVDAKAPVFHRPIVAPKGEKGPLDTARDVYDDIVKTEQMGDVPFVLDDELRAFVCADDASSLEKLSSWESRLKEAVAEVVNDPDAEDTQAEVMDRFTKEADQTFAEGSEALRVTHNLEAVFAPGEEDLEPSEIMLVYRPAINSYAVSRLEIGGAKEVLLEDHEKAVSALARSIAQTVGVSPSYEEAVALAGAHHDDGKADPRFQRMLAGGRKPIRLLAKSRERSRAEVIRLYMSLGISGWRHEQLSAAMTWHALRADDTDDAGIESREVAESLPADMRQLVTRLVGTSHGRGRAAFDSGVEGLCADEDVNAEIGPAMDVLFGSGLWESIIAHTDQVYGYWGTAYLEAIVRAADARESALEQGGDCK